MTTPRPDAMTTPRPDTYALWQEAGGDHERYRALLIQHGHLVPRPDALTEHAARLRTWERHAEREVAALLEALDTRPEDLPEPRGPVARKWWRLGWLSAQAVVKAALTDAGTEEVGR